jgi:hypothetical protein
MADSSVHDRYLQVLMSHVAGDPYPSATQMDQIEAMLTRDEFESCVEVLLGKIEEADFPSISMMQRVERLLQRFG